MRLKYDFDVAILADGLFPQRKEIQDLITRIPLVVCCDGASQKLVDFGRIPDFIVGDLDSTLIELKESYPERMIHMPDQNSNDLTKSVHFCLSKGLRKIIILGATGLREDHTLGNISLLQAYAPIVDEVVMASDYGVFTPITQTTTFESYVSQQVSIFSLTPESTLSTIGLKYSIENRSLLSWWEGTLNESLGDGFTIQLHTVGRFIVYRAF
jgi:thiamine pyrophosphokinase